jgi:hypothetical protein
VSAAVITDACCDFRVLDNGIKLYRRAYVTRICSKISYCRHVCCARVILLVADASCSIRVCTLWQTCVPYCNTLGVTASNNSLNHVMSIMFMYYCMWQNAKLNFVALILKLSSKLFLVQVFFRSPNHFHSS